MEYGYSILMGIFAAAILLYAGLMALTKDYNILPLRSRQSVHPKDPKRYMSVYVNLRGTIRMPR